MTKIEWADHTINPVVGCSKCSPGCDNCYAEKMAYRLSKMPATVAKYAGVVDENGWTGKVSALDLTCFDKLPKKPCKVFVGSMTDIFQQKIAIGEYSKSFLPMIFDAMASFPQHTFMLLTKRPENMKAWIDFTLEACVEETLPNLWLGTTVCNQQEADKNIPLLLATPAAKRFVSVEPMLGAVDLQAYTLPVCPTCERGVDNSNGNAESRWCQTCGNEQGIIGLDWVICGGETGPGARPMHPDWVRGLRDQCQLAGVPFFFKGWGEWGPTAYNYIDQQPVFRTFGSFAHYCNKAPSWMHRGDKLICPDGHIPTHGGEEGKTYPMCVVSRIGKKVAGRLLDGKTWGEVPG